MSATTVDPHRTRWAVYGLVFGYLLGLTFSLLGRVEKTEDRLDAIEKALAAKEAK